MDPKEIEYFDRKLDSLHSKIDACKEEVQVVRDEVGERLQRHKGELMDRIESVRSEVRKQSEQSAARWAVIDKDLAVHKQETCKDVVEHVKESHNIAKLVGILVGIMTSASIGAAFLVWLIGRVRG